MFDYKKKTQDTKSAPFVDARPDLGDEPEAQMCSTSMPPLNETDVTDRGPMPPEGPKERMNASKPWKPKGR